ncbi:hypothetical protein [Roseiconus lacunae]|uniref:Uncharacterized protein n=1 Tax=Roseiconus lacunae TaxID=2605694 RepID=A0ABT7PHC8_9BACT|nr:hypothetical protein [Roseiconus lacunae]MDM4015914.1 hypothetical protein [Roseiconus lacunae]
MAELTRIDHKSNNPYEPTCTESAPVESGIHYLLQIVLFIFGAVAGLGVFICYYHGIDSVVADTKNEPMRLLGPVILFALIAVPVSSISLWLVKIQASWEVVACRAIASGGLFGLFVLPVDQLLHHVGFSLGTPLQGVTRTLSFFAATVICGVQTMFAQRIFDRWWENVIKRRRNKTR